MYWLDSTGWILWLWIKNSVIRWDGHDVDTGYVNHYRISLIPEFHASGFKHQLFKCKSCVETQNYIYKCTFPVFPEQRYSFNDNNILFIFTDILSEQPKVRLHITGYLIANSRVLCSHFRVWVISFIALIIINERETNLIKANHCCPFFFFHFTKHGFPVLRINPFLKMAFPGALWWQRMAGERKRAKVFLLYSMPAICP